MQYMQERYVLLSSGCIFPTFNVQKRGRVEKLSSIVCHK